MPIPYEDSSGIYEGSAPYVFISYSHKDQLALDKVKDVLAQNKIRYWYDDGLHSGDDWNKTIASHVKNSAVCLLLLSPASASSEYVKNELNFAQTHRVPIHTLMLRDFELPDDIEMMTGRIQRIQMKGNYASELTRALPRQVFSSPPPAPAKKPSDFTPVQHNPTPPPVRTYHSPKRASGNTVKLLVIAAVICAIVSVSAFFLWPKVIYPTFIYPNEPSSELYTPELLQSYSGSYQTNRVSGKATMTFTECNAAGQVKGYFEFITDGGYGKYEISGTITHKTNKGNLTISVVPGNWIIQPNGFSPLEAMEVSISKNFQSFSCSTYRMNWSAGELEDENGIKTAHDLGKLSGSNGVFYLRNDIDLEGTNWSPIAGFTGTLIGNGFTIRNMTIEADSSNVGFFSVLEGTVTDLHFENASVTVSGRNENIGILCGELKGTISNICTSGTVSAEKSSVVAGVAGLISTKGAYSLIGVENQAAVHGLKYVGGCYGVINNKSNAGDPLAVTLSDNTNAGEVTAEEDIAGGIVSYIYGEDSVIGGSISFTVQDCVNTGTIRGQYCVGGIVGSANSDGDSWIDNCSNKSEIHAAAYTGCIAGETGKFCITNCDNEGSTLTASGYYLIDGEKYALVGGLVGKGTCLENCTNYIDIVYSGDGAFVGGLMGYCNLDQAVFGETLASDSAQAHIKNLTNMGQVSGYSYVGGITGGIMYFWENGCTKVSATFEQLANHGQIEARGDFAGGLAGYMSGDVGGLGGGLSWFIYDCINDHDVSGVNNVGGLFGGFRNGQADGPTYASNTVTIDGCQVTGQVKGNKKTGEIIGLDEIKRS